MWRGGAWAGRSGYVPLTLQTGASIDEMACVSSAGPHTHAVGMVSCRGAWRGFDALPSPEVRAFADALDRIPFAPAPARYGGRTAPAVVQQVQAGNLDAAD